MVGVLGTPHQNFVLVRGRLNLVYLNSLREFPGNDIKSFPFIVFSGCWELNPVYLLPKQTYYRYTTARENDEPQSRRLSACPVQFNGVELVGIYDTPITFLLYIIFRLFSSQKRSDDNRSVLLFLGLLFLLRHCRVRVNQSISIKPIRTGDSQVFSCRLQTILDFSWRTRAA